METRELIEHLKNCVKMMDNDDDLCCVGCPLYDDIWFDTGELRSKNDVFLNMKIQMSPCLMIVHLARQIQEPVKIKKTDGNND